MTCVFVSVSLRYKDNNLKTFNKTCIKAVYDIGFPTKFVRGIGDIYRVQLKYKVFFLPTKR